jgi:hypothetical protein
MNAAKLRKANAFNCRFKVKLSPDAESMAYFLQQERLDTNPKKGERPLSMYPCLSCGFLHLGHQRPQFRNAN